MLTKFGFDFTTSKRIKNGDKKPGEELCFAMPDEQQQQLKNKYLMTVSNMGGNIYLSLDVKSGVAKNQISDNP